MLNVLSDAKYKGIDISCWNDDTIDWARVKAAGINFVIIRAGFGNSITQVDSHFKMYIEGALAAGIHVGVYWMSYAISTEDAIKEAQVFKQVITPYSGRIDFPTGFDWEYDSENYFVKQTGRHPTRDEISNMCVAFCNEMENGHWYAVNYQNIDYTKHKYVASTMKDLDSWLADYSGDPDFICGMQQIQSDGRINGVDGNVDVNVAYKDYPALIKSLHFNGLISQVTQVTQVLRHNSLGQSGPNPTIKFSGKYRKTIEYLQDHVKVQRTGIANLATYNACKAYTIQQGDSGPITLWLQQYLNGQGFNCGPSDGKAGALTLNGIKAFQKAYGLGQGYLGGTDWYYIIEP